MVDWWEPTTKASYLKKAECIIAQYGNYSIPDLGLNVRGVNTQGENIADNGGIKEAYRAYSKQQSRPEMGKGPVWCLGVLLEIYINDKF